MKCLLRCTQFPVPEPDAAHTVTQSRRHSHGCTAAPSLRYGAILDLGSLHLDVVHRTVPNEGPAQTLDVNHVEVFGRPSFRRCSVSVGARAALCTGCSVSL
ncbi:hypothetical protein PsYK624_087100 [Phanerochaete sordida]|uniref:Uncharacterized protein n=1 Tax=Phanerochaete sordida TaxID=48140 RepID=A0A9P3GD62_9APHY|nr:hypothetical protein PsYK624_087100 [Phanerochaete sordida]